MDDLTREMTPSHQRRHSAERGLTLLEVMIALVIMAIGLLALSGMQITTIQKNASSFKSTIAVSLAEQYLQQLENLSFSDPLLTGSATSYTANAYAGTYTDPNTNIVYNRTYLVTDNSPIANVKLVTYSVIWMDPIPAATGGAHQLSDCNANVHPWNCHYVSLLSRIRNEAI